MGVHLVGYCAFGPLGIGHSDGRTGLQCSGPWPVESHECADCGERSRTAGNDGTCRIDRQDRSWRARELEMPPLDDP